MRDALSVHFFRRAIRSAVQKGRTPARVVDRDQCRVIGTAGCAAPRDRPDGPGRRRPASHRDRCARERRGTDSAAYQAGMEILRGRIHRLAAGGLLRVDEEFAASVIHATARGAVLTWLSLCDNRRDAALLTILRAPPSPSANPPYARRAPPALLGCCVPFFPKRRTADLSVRRGSRAHDHRPSTHAIRHDSAFVDERGDLWCGWFCFRGLGGRGRRRRGCATDRCRCSPRCRAGRASPCRWVHGAFDLRQQHDAASR
ncbi:hypothetical protein SAMN04489730_8364 [Amycolatopsis australiensis]|uniref:Uncharacterized protein n=1 Tax=Amycolatopsis australiensis TaxID=546364 RepID=A0A1K1T6A4_9PSEU|nr:hypothetical protein SAMN04489730_8364 [Amycolatopsis australiensis]